MNILHAVIFNRVRIKNCFIPPCLGVLRFVPDLRDDFRLFLRGLAGLRLLVVVFLRARGLGERGAAISRDPCHIASINQNWPDFVHDNARTYGPQAVFVRLFQILQAPVLRVFHPAGAESTPQGSSRRVRPGRWTGGNSQPVPGSFAAPTGQPIAAPEQNHGQYIFFSFAETNSI